MGDSQLIFLIGPRGCGKTTIGRALADRLVLPFHDTDRLIVDEAGRSIEDIVQREGWQGFRARERRALSTCVPSTGGGRAVIACGGGTVLNAANRELMRAHGLVVYLVAPLECLKERITKDPGFAMRPSLTGLGLIEEITCVLEEREPLYTGAAHKRVDSSTSVEAAVNAILAAWDEHKEV